MSSSDPELGTSDFAGVLSALGPIPLKTVTREGAQASLSALEKVLLVEGYAVRSGPDWPMGSSLGSVREDDAHSRQIGANEAALGRRMPALAELRKFLELVLQQPGHTAGSH